MAEGTLLVCRKTVKINMEECFFSLVITIGDVIDLTAMHINKGNALFVRESKGNARGTQQRA